MSSYRSRLLISSLIAALVAALSVTVLSPASPASAHGNVINPPSRNYGCWQRWGSDFQNPRMATEDPMCWQAWQADPNAMWNWNGLFREGVAGNHQGAIPDGQLCSGGRTQSGRYNALDAVGSVVTAAGRDREAAQLMTERIELLSRLPRHDPRSGGEVADPPIRSHSGYPEAVEFTRERAVVARLLRRTVPSPRQRTG